MLDSLTISSGIVVTLLVLTFRVAVSPAWGLTFTEKTSPSALKAKKGFAWIACSKCKNSV